MSKCDNCKHKQSGSDYVENHYCGSWMACMKGHWDSGCDGDTYDSFWDNCKDYRYDENKLGMYISVSKLLKGGE